MKKQIQNNSVAGQSNTEMRKSQKHDANLQKNSALYFQVGLILCLLGTFALFEMQFETKGIVAFQPDANDEIIEVAMTDVVEYKQEAQKIEKQKQSKIITDILKVIEDDATTDELKPENLITDSKPVFVDKPVTRIDDINPIDPPEDIHVTAVEFVPIFPGCEKYELNSARKKCLNEKINKLVQRKFNTDLAANYGLSGVQRINVEFKVDKTGYITDIKTRAPHPKLEEEANRIANKIPKMKPGKMGTTPVNVIYNLPITFKVQN